MERNSIISATVLIIFRLCGSLCAQPAAFTHVVHPLEHTEAIVPEPIDLQTVLEEDRQRESQVGPYPFAIPRAVHITPETNGLWEQIDDETFLWRLPIASPEALSLSLGFTRYMMPAGGRMYIYSIDESQVIGPFTEKNNKEHGQLWTPAIDSEAIVVEVTIPSLKVPDLELELSYINHGYRGLNSIPLFDVGDSDWCHRNVACPEGNDWRDQIRSVAKYTILFEYGPDDRRMGCCTGALINNTAQDNKPYFLTAFHCFNSDNDTILNGFEKEATKTMVMYWKFQAAECEGSDDYDAQYQSGANFRAGYWKSDFALVELEDMPPQPAETYYAGWNRSDTTPSGAGAIHHPKGDLKKISIEYAPLRKIGVTDRDSSTYFIVNEWDVGITQEGSSGCPLFDTSNKQIVGQLRGITVENEGDESTCNNPRPSLFGPLYRSWSEGKARDTRLSDWLDPLDTGVMFLDGKDPGYQACDMVTVGNIATEDITHIYPMATEYEDSRTQVIYLADEIGQKGFIKRLALDITTVPGQRMNDWTIRMKHTAKSQYSICEFETTGWTVVYQSNESISTTGWRWFEFRTPFEYDGISNLLVDFSFNNSSTSSHGECRWSSSASKRSVLFASSGEYGDPLDWTFTMQDCLEYIPNIKLKICELWEEKVVAEDGQSGDALGCSVSISGDYAIVGAERDDDNGANSGSAYIFKREGMRWIQEDKLLVDSPGMPPFGSDMYGHSVSISGNYAVLGTYYGTTAYIFNRAGTNWTPQDTLEASISSGRDLRLVAVDSGRSVSISGDYAILSAGSLGSAHVFKRAGTSWTLQDVLVAPDDTTVHYFGRSVSIAGDYAIVGGEPDPLTRYPGLAPPPSWPPYIFKRAGTSWTQQDKLIASDGSSGDYFGRAFAISGDYVVVGALRSAYVFKREGTEWAEKQKLTASDGAVGDDFGTSVAIGGDYIVVGATGDDDNGDNSGSVYVFKREGTNWIGQRKLTASDGTSGDRFGGSVAISGDHVIVGATGDDDKGDDSGAAYIFRLP